MLDDLHIFETYMASDAFRNLPDREREEFISSYNNFVEEEMDLVLQEAKVHLQQKNISDLFLRMYGSLDKEVLRLKDEEWNKTFGFHPLQVLNLV
jgi:hypothetical protein